MALQLILGRSGSGKTHHLYEQIIQEAIANPDRLYLVVVPEQFTLETQRELVLRHPGHALTNIDILSFHRLGIRILEAQGAMEREILDDTGKNFILRRIASQKSEELQLLRGNLKKMGYIDEIKSFLSELEQYQVSPEDILLLAKATDRPQLAMKLQDIHQMYEAYLAYTQEHFVTTEGMLSQVSQMVPDVSFLKKAVIAFDGFTGFTPIQLTLLSELLLVAEELRVTVTCDPQEDIVAQGEMQDLFYLSRETIRALMRIASEQGIAVKDPEICTEGFAHRYAKAPMLAHLEAQLFRPVSRQFREQEASSQIRICSLQSRREELRFCAREICRLRDQAGYSYGEMAVVTGDVSRYQDEIEKVFAEYGIPVFVDSTTKLVFHPFIDCVRGILQLFVDDFSYQSVFGYLRTGFTSLSTGDIDALENYVLASGIRGASMWKKEWKRNPLRVTEEELARYNVLRETVFSTFAPLREAFADKERTVRSLTEALYRFLVETQTAEQMAQHEAALREDGDLVRSEQMRQVYQIIMKLFEKLVHLLGVEKVTVREYKEILEAGLSAVSLGVTPPERDTVVFGDIQRTRLTQVKVLFLLGVNDGVIPSYGGEGGILSEFERESLRAQGASLAYGARENALLQNFYIYWNLTKPGEKLYMTFSRLDDEGKAQPKSVLISSILRLFHGLEVEAYGDSGGIAEPSLDFLQTPDGALSWFAQTLRETLDGAPQDEVWMSLFSWYWTKALYSPRVERLLRAAQMQKLPRQLRKDTALSLYGEKLDCSVSRLEMYNNCPYKHFLNYGIKLQERMTYAFRAVDMGNVFHDAILRFAQKVEEEKLTFHDLTDPQVEDFADFAMKIVLSDMEQSALYHTAESSYMAERMRRVFARTARTVTWQIQQGSFEPVACEKPFLVQVDDEISLKGRIDRIDLAEADDEQLVRVVDYKSSSKKLDLTQFYEGMSLQLLLYLKIATDSYRGKANGKTVKPAGLFYYGMVDPMVEEDKTDGSPEQMIRKKLRMEGRFEANEDVARAMDGSGATHSDVVALDWNKNGSMSAKSATWTAEEMGSLLEYAKTKAVDSGKEILAGEVSVSPMGGKQTNACDYCAYRAVCGFDKRLPGYTYREKTCASEGEVLAKIKQEGGA